MEKLITINPKIILRGNIFNESGNDFYGISVFYESIATTTFEDDYKRFNCLNRMENYIKYSSISDIKLLLDSYKFDNKT